MCSSSGFPVAASESAHCVIHCVEASSVSQSSLTKLGSACAAAVWSRRMPLGTSGAILSLLDGPAGGDPMFHVVWSRFRMIRRFSGLPTWWNWEGQSKIAPCFSWLSWPFHLLV